MTRKEWFDNQTPEIQEKFKYNCNNLNEGIQYFDYWINNTNGVKGLGGAFVFCKSSEGHDYWYDQHRELRSIQQ